MKNDRIFKMRIDPAIENKLQELSQKSGLKKSAVVRALITGGAIREPPPLDYRAMTAQLRAIGSNMNQIAHVANATGQADRREYKENAAALHRALVNIMRAVELC
jgi:antitoxin component of RelBE/YafQ-DinJ toxin-antitoxin module